MEIHNLYISPPRHQRNIAQQCAMIMIRAPSWLRLIPGTRTRQLGTRFGRSGFFAFGNKMVIVITVVVVDVDAQVEQSA